MIGLVGTDIPGAIANVAADRAKEPAVKETSPECPANAHAVCSQAQFVAFNE